MNEMILMMETLMKFGCKVSHHGGKNIQIDGKTFHANHMPKVRALLYKWRLDARMEKRGI